MAKLRYLIVLLIGLMCGLLEAKVHELKCTVEENWCQLKKMQPLLPNTKDDKYVFTGVSNEEKKNITVIYFDTYNVTFLPKEAIETFPNLNAIGFTEIEMETLELYWLKSLTDSFNTKNIKALYLEDAGIEMIQPGVDDIFEIFDRIDLSGSRCVDFEFIREKGHFDLFEEKLASCTEKFEEIDPILEFPPVVTPTLNVTELMTDIETIKTTLVEGQKIVAQANKETIQELKGLDGKIKEIEKLNENQKKTLEDLEKSSENQLKTLEKVGTTLGDKMQDLEKSNKNQLKTLESKIQTTLVDKLEELENSTKIEHKILADQIQTTLGNKMDDVKKSCKSMEAMLKSMENSNQCTVLEDKFDETLGDKMTTLEKSSKDQIQILKELKKNSAPTKSCNDYSNLEKKLEKLEKSIKELLEQQKTQPTTECPSCRSDGEFCEEQNDDLKKFYVSLFNKFDKKISTKLEQHQKTLKETIEEEVERVCSQ